MSTTLYGSKSTPDQVRKHITELRLGNPDKKVAPLNVTEISKRLGISRETVYQYLKKAEELKEITVDSEGKIQVNKQLVELKEYLAFNENHPITDDEIIQGWMSRCNLMGHTSKGVKSLKTHIQYLQKVCNELRIAPIQLTIDLSTSEKYAQAYFDKLKSGEIERRQKRTKSSIHTAFYGVRMAIRHLMQYNQRNPISIPRGQGGILSGKILNHGNYADIQLSDDEIIQAEKHIIEKYGLDSDIYRVFFFGVETCSRKEAILNTTLEWTEDTDEDGDLTYYMTVIETKTEHIKEGKQHKFIERAKTQESLRLAKQRGQNRLWNDKEMSKDKAYRTLTAQLKEIYSYLGKTQHYFFEEAFHSLRHIGAHYNLRKTDYNYGFVATIGGWTVIDELKNSYGEMPPSIVKKLMKKGRKALNEL